MFWKLKKNGFTGSTLKVIGTMGRNHFLFSPLV